MDASPDPAPIPSGTPAPFGDFFASLDRTPLRDAVSAAHRRPEAAALAPLLDLTRIHASRAAGVQALAERLAGSLRERGHDAGASGRVQALLQAYSLSSAEGIALMCLAEALLRIPDTATRDALIRDKIREGDWHAHLGRGRSLFVNAATWGLLVTGRLFSPQGEDGLAESLRRALAAGSGPLVRGGVDLAMRMLGEQFVAGETIEQALARAAPLESRGFRHSFDMLGEAALTANDAARYTSAYEAAIDAIGATGNTAGGAGEQGLLDRSGISIKLSALHPHYRRADVARVHAELFPRLAALAARARLHGIGLNIDAEESDRLELSLDLLERLCREPGLAGWDGVGFVVQAYQKRAPAVVDFVIDLARRSGLRLMVRLVKGAYWDTEIKRAQLAGTDDYPVWTRKAHTDIAFVACARRLLDAADAVFPQFATHNAHTIASIHELAGGTAAPPDRYEFQCLHGMGEALYEPVVAPVDAGGLGRRCRIYAPVGTHETLLAYLVRRLLENGANSSFVHRAADPAVSIASLVEDPVHTVERTAAVEGTRGLPHPTIPLPGALPTAPLGAARRPARGVDLADEAQLRTLAGTLMHDAAIAWKAGPMTAAADGDSNRVDADADGDGPAAPGTPEHPICNPADHRDVIGAVREASTADVDAALHAAAGAAAGWAATSPGGRATLLERTADRLEADTDRLLGLLVREAGKTVPAAAAEVREAVDFLRYYAAEARTGLSPGDHRPLGPVACISPWNFPLAIFTGQVAAALAAGNPVLAKPAEQTPLAAAEAVRALHAAGVPADVVQLLPGPGETVGAALVADPRVQGVLFTGSTEVARALQRTLGARLNADGAPVPLVAETGGQNAMIVDASALPEQVVADVLASAFDSAGQRCSALRVLCVQAEVADRTLAMLEGAMRELRVDRPDRLATDLGPVIDAGARDAIEHHLDSMRARGHRIVRPAAVVADAARHGTFVAPALVTIARIDEIGREVFGPVLHVLRWQRDGLDALLDAIDATGYGLTLGVHTRIDDTVARVVARSRAGNVYVNRNMIGAVVGVQPFGGHGLSGTGPKAGGPLALLRLLARAPGDAAARAVHRAGTAIGLGEMLRPGMRWLEDARAATGGPVDAHGTQDTANGVLAALGRWAREHGRTDLAETCERFADRSPVGAPRRLPGPTGQLDVYVVQPRAVVLCIADAAADRLAQLAAVLAVGARALWPTQAIPSAAQLPAPVRARIMPVPDALLPEAAFDAVLHHGDDNARLALCRRIAQRPGALVPVQALPPGDHHIALERLCVERTVSIDTTAAGGNASLMTVG